MRQEAWLPRAARPHPDRRAVDDLTYGELRPRGRRRRGARRRGAAAGDRVALALAPGLDFVVAFHACLLLGAVAVPVDLRLAERERAVRARGARLTVDAPLPEDGPPLAAASWADADVAMVVHTSGTTACPGVELTYGNSLRRRGLGGRLGLDPRERWLCPLPLSHVGGLSVLLRAAIYATTVLLSRPSMPPRWPSAGREDATVASLVPTCSRGCSTRACTPAGAALRAARRRPGRRRRSSTVPARRACRWRDLRADRGVLAGTVRARRRAGVRPAAGRRRPARATTARSSSRARS